MNFGRWPWRASAGALLFVVAPVAADPGHEVNIEALTAQIVQTPGIPELYYQRGVNFREIPRLAEARADFEKALSLQPSFLPAGRELARLDDREGKRAAGIARLQSLLAAPPAEAAFHVPGCCAALAELLLKDQRNEEALAAAARGIALSTDQTIDLQLLRAEAQRRLGRHEDRVRDLAAAAASLKSFVLRIAWIEALIDAGHVAAALPEIDREIATSRYQAAWRIRRARALLRESGTPRRAEAVNELAQALAEIEGRLRPERPDLSLLCERALIHALTGRRAEADAGLAEARRMGADDWMTRILEAELKSPRDSAGRDD